LKFVTEYTLALVLFLLALPIVFLAAVLIKTTSKGPIFYLQPRVGKDGKVFRVIKLRTMIDKAENATGAVWSTPDDPRITRAGRFLRDTHIDEFPQIINVLMGQMSLVGPRPERPEIVETLEWKIANYSERLNVRPGITGLSQMKLPPDTDLESVRHKQVFDLYYVANVGPWLDVRILASTGRLLACTVLQGTTSLDALPSSNKVFSSVETVLGPDSELLARQRSLPPR
jgi:lipopolysaccharide/colanic/teichoic acid biosynthesis glycosyltransferase